jgi:DNA-binding beta-propeller fold protein YncE
MRRRRGSVGAALALLGASLGLAACGGGPGDGKAAPIKYTKIIGGLGDTPGRFGYPRCIDHDATALWVIDKTARVQRIDPETGRCLAWFHMPEWELGKPTGFCVAPGPDKDGKWCEELLYIADTHYHRIMVYNPPHTTPEGDGGKLEPVAKWGEYGTGPGQFYYPTDVAVLLKEGQKAIDRIYVSEYGGNDRVSVFNARHEFMYSFGVQGMGTDPTKIEFNRPQSLVIRTKSDGSRELDLTDACNHRIGRFTLDGKLIGWISSAANQGRAPGQFYVPYGLVLLPDGTAMVSEFGGARAQRIDLDTGKSLGCWGEPGREPGQVLAPWAITWMNDTVYLLDSGNNRITAFSRPG